MTQQAAGTSRALEQLRTILRYAEGDSWPEKVLYVLDQRDERILELEMDVAYWRDKYDELKETHGA